MTGKTRNAGNRQTEEIIVMCFRTPQKYPSQQSCYGVGNRGIGLTVRPPVLSSGRPHKSCYGVGTTGIGLTVRPPVLSSGRH